MTKGSEIVQEWRENARKDHVANIRVSVVLFVGWLVVMGLVAEVSHGLWGESVWGFMGFLVAGYAGFLGVIWLLVKEGEHERRMDQRFKVLVARRIHEKDKIKFEKYGNKRKDSVGAASADYPG